MIEVEIKLKIDDKEKVLSKLIEMGFVSNGIVTETDTYYDTKSGDIRQDDKALRIRTTTGITTGTDTITPRTTTGTTTGTDTITPTMGTDTITFCQLNFKDKKFDNKSMTRPEYETEISDPVAIEKILNSLGYFSVIPKVAKSRHQLSYKNIHACLDTVDGLGEYLELESIVEEASMKASALHDIELILHQLGYKMEDTTTVSYLSALQGICNGGCKKTVRK